MGTLTKALFRTFVTTASLKECRHGHSFQFIKNKPKLHITPLNVRYASSSATKYTAAILKKVGEPLALEDVPRKPLKKGEIRIGIYCCGINSIDQLTVSGGVDNPPALPVVPGYEVSGEILEVKDVDGDEGLRPGQRVIAMHPEFQGGFAEEMVVPAKDVWAVNNSLGFTTGATLVNSYATALLALSRRGEVKKGDSVLITGAGGRLGLAAVDLAANVYKCKVIALCSSADKATAARERGAFATIIEGKQDLIAEVKRANDGKGVKIIIDPVGGDVFKRAVQCAENEGRVIVAGFASKRIPQIGADELLENSYSVIGVSLDQYRKNRFDVYRSAITEVIEMADENLIKPYSAKHYPLEKVNEALESLKDPKAIGKYVIDVK